jgi:hypothetical protein
MMNDTVTDNFDVVMWDALARCINDYRKKYPGGVGHDYEHNHDHYKNYMKSNWGIDHGPEHIQVVDQQKYTMFVLRWA